MTNPVKKLIKDILTETKSDPHLKKKLLNDLTKETKEYYKILNQRAKDNQHIAKLELKMLKEKIYKDIQTFDQAFESFRQRFIYPERNDS